MYVVSCISGILRERDHSGTPVWPPDRPLGGRRRPSAPDRWPARSRWAAPLRGVGGVVGAPPAVGSGPVAGAEPVAGADAAVVGAGAGPSPARSLVTRHAAVLKYGCLETGSHTVMVSSFACRRWSPGASPARSHDP